MRFSTIVSSLLCFSSVLGASLHQHIVKRSSSDFCVSLDLNLDFNRHGFGHIDACVCLSTLDMFIETNIITRAAAKKFGSKQIKELLVSEINAHRQKKKCTYPRYGKANPAPKCQPQSDPCGFTCTDGFTANSRKRTCDCPSPKIVYNGKCIDKPGRPGGKGPQPSGKPKPQPQPPRGHH